ncbi:DUF4231 domain-containing protein [uncultured Leifsonia sp.]|uniref:DUF4231 domain-containing protein n=1 Tax=uncultured Leifsonia sp. TaxID=340359 RepID=UPI0028D2B1B5|nr:DUF4231 domain-containing protein [uncultured Leifsonia sp.]
MPTPFDADVLDELIDIRADISAAEERVRRSRVAIRALKTIAVVLVLMWACAVTVGVLFASSADLAGMWIPVVLLTILSGVGIAVLSTRETDNIRLIGRRTHELGLEQLYITQALHFSGRAIPVELRQYVYRGEMQRSIVSTRKSGDRYRRANNSFQSVIIVGSLATTAVASLNTGEGALKWVAVGLSFTVGLSAGFTGYFKYRERAFYLRQTADEMEEQLNAYELGLTPYEDGSETERIGRLTARIESIRVAQQQREQQLDQPKAQSRET